jgi:hypothetical protein
LKKKIGEKMGATYEIYKGLRNLQASKIVRKFMANGVSQSLIVANDSDKVNVVLQDGEEVFFELESQDLWLHVAFHMYTLEPLNVTPMGFKSNFLEQSMREELISYGATEVRVDKKEALHTLKLKLQRVAYDLWYQTLKGTDKLYIVE